MSAVGFFQNISHESVIAVPSTACLTPKSAKGEKSGSKGEGVHFRYHKQSLSPVGECPSTGPLIKLSRVKQL
jgi:hypothetical protein